MMDHNIHFRVVIRKIISFTPSYLELCITMFVFSAISQRKTFLAHPYESTESYCFHCDVGVGHTFKFYVKVFYVMDKALSNEQFCMWTSLV